MRIFVFSFFLVSSMAYAALPESCKYSCSSQCVQDLSFLDFEIQQFKNKNCNIAPPVSSDSIQLFYSDSCTSGFLTSVNVNSNCDVLSTVITDNVWGVKIKNQCVNISDLSFKVACELFKGGASGSQLYNSDRCASSSLMGIVNYSTRCEALKNVSNNVWAVKVNDQCHNISDISAQAACERFKAASIGVAMFHSDSCQPSEILAIVDASTNCDQLVGGSNVWAVEINGQCMNISDLDIVKACKVYGGNANIATHPGGPFPPVPPVRR